MQNRLHLHIIFLQNLMAGLSQNANNAPTYRIISFPWITGLFSHFAFKKTIWYTIYCIHSKKLLNFSLFRTHNNIFKSTNLTLSCSATCFDRAAVTAASSAIQMRSPEMLTAAKCWSCTVITAAMFNSSQKLCPEMEAAKFYKVLDLLWVDYHGTALCCVLRLPENKIKYYIIL